jgi:hypothetical protein
MDDPFLSESSPEKMDHLLISESSLSSGSFPKQETTHQKWIRVDNPLSTIVHPINISSFSQQQIITARMDHLVTKIK